MTPKPLSTPRQWFTCVRLLRSYLMCSAAHLFPQRTPPALLAQAACGGLKPGPATRPRGASPHLSYSSTLRSPTSVLPCVFVTHAKPGALDCEPLKAALDGACGPLSPLKGAGITAGAAALLADPLFHGRGCTHAPPLRLAPRSKRSTRVPRNAGRRSSVAARCTCALCGWRSSP